MESEMMRLQEQSLRFKDKRLQSFIYCIYVDSDIMPIITRVCMKLIRIR
jgi:hypothetical protein